MLRPALLLAVMFLGPVMIADSPVWAASGTETNAPMTSFPPTIISRLSRATVPIACARLIRGALQLSNINGSGFFVNRNGDVLTAAHVVNSLGGCVPTIYLPRSGWSFTQETVEAKWFSISSCNGDMAVDVAVCHLQSNPFKDPGIEAPLEIAELNIETEPEGTPVAFTGFPLNNAHPITSVGIVAGYYWENHQRFLFVDKAAWPGASGSPLYGTDGRVVGIVLRTGMCQSNTQDACRYAGLTFARTAGFIDGFLTSRHVTHKVYSGVESQTAQ